MKVMFVTRKFPPQVGGMETLSDHVWQALEPLPGAALVANRRSNQWLPVWFPVALWRMRRAIASGQVDLVLTGDALTQIVLGPFIPKRRTRNTTMVMGLDLTWRPRAYQWSVRRSLRRPERILAISEATGREATVRGVDSNRLTVVALGVDAPEIISEERRAARRHIAESHNLDPSVPILVSVGRLVTRKGFAWFLAEVLPRIDTPVSIVIAGDGPDREAVESAAANSRHPVVVPGRVTDDERHLLMTGADLFVQPNIAVAGDMEGFGLVTIEAALRGTPVLAANLEGLTDAVRDGETGTLLPSGDATVWAATISRIIADPASDEERNALAVRTRALYGQEAFRRRLLAALDDD